MALLTANTKYGILRGVPGRNPDNTVFKGVPYAKPPVGELRFAPPQECDPWKGEWICDRYQASAIQKLRHHPDVKELSEDCLYLNIWTPANGPDEKLPVLFWIHGGGFIAGTGNTDEFDGEALNGQGVILITINYRLGALGYLALPELETLHGNTGNNGLLDQIAALKWVYENISTFGGDPENITVFGFSAGGMSVRMLACSPLTKGMISKIIVQSGGGITDSDYYRPLEEKMEICVRAMKNLGWTLHDLMEKDACEVSETLQAETLKEMESWEKSVFQPNTDNNILLESPGISLWKGDCPDIPMMAGSVTGDNGWIKIVRHEVTDETMIPAFVYSRGVSWAERNLEIGRKPLYTYHFERTQPKDRWWSDTNRTPHGSCVPYIMGTLYNEDYTSYDHELSDLMVRYWANFAKTGNPNGNGLMEWPAYTDEHRVSLHITDEGYCAETLAKTDATKRAIRFVTDHPGVIRSLKGL